MVTSALPTLRVYLLSLCRAQFISFQVSSSFKVSYLASLSCAPRRPCEAAQPRFSAREQAEHVTSLVAFWDVNVCLQCGGSGGFRVLSFSFMSLSFFFFPCAWKTTAVRALVMRGFPVYWCTCVYNRTYITCAYTTYEFSQDFYVGRWRQLKRITVLGRPHYLRYQNCTIISTITAKSTSPIIDRLKIIILHIILLPSSPWRHRALWRPRPLQSPAPSEQVSRVCPVFVRLVCCAKRAEF